MATEGGSSWQLEPARGVLEDWIWAENFALLHAAYAYHTFTRSHFLVSQATASRNAGNTQNWLR